MRPAEETGSEVEKRGQVRVSGSPSAMKVVRRAEVRTWPLFEEFIHER